jgi:hypothetical protein
MKAFANILFKNILSLASLFKFCLNRHFLKDFWIILAF